MEQYIFHIAGVAVSIIAYFLKDLLDKFKTVRDKQEAQELKITQLEMKQEGLSGKIELQLEHMKEAIQRIEKALTEKK
jgi:site-specific DNA-adenine methylase